MIRLPAFFLLFAASLAPGIGAAAPGSPQPAGEIAANIEARLRSLRSLQADFEQAYYSMASSEPLRERGVFSFQKPDLMRWAYAAPEENLFLYKDGRFLFYIAEENQLVVSGTAGDRYESEVLAIFTGARRLTDDYVVEPTAFPTDRRDTVQIRLTPRSEETETSSILLEADRKSWLIQRAVFFDWAGNKQEFFFRRIRTDLKFPAGHFEFDPPPGCEIIEDRDDRAG